MKRFVVNILEAGKRRALEVTESEHQRISSQLVRDLNGGPRLIIHEKLENGTRTHFVAPSKIVSVDELAEDDWT